MKATKTLSITTSHVLYFSLLRTRFINSPPPLLLHHTIREVTGHIPLVALESLVDHTVLNNPEDDISLGFIVPVITSSYSRIYRR